jgi:DNA primase
MEYMSHWHISKRTFEFYKTPTKVVNGVPVSVGFPYETPIGEGYKIRFLDKKEFKSTYPEMRKATLFGKQFFPKGSKDQVVITEGEKDALAAYEMLLGQAAVVSVRGGSSAFRDIKAERDYLISFPRIVLALDNDEVGREAFWDIRLQHPI